MKNLSNLVNRTAVAVARANALHVSALIVAAGGLLVLVANVQEMLYVRHLMELSGPGARDAYYALVAANRSTGLGDFLIRSITHALPGVGDPLKGVGMWIAFVVAPGAASVTLFARLVRLTIHHARTSRAG